MAEVTVLVPVYNGEKYLPECLDSVIRQDFHDWELIAVDDGSTDSSSEILSHYSKMDSRIRFICKSNSGLMGSIREGIEHVQTRYVMYLDGDDTYKDKMISTLLNKIKMTGADCVRGGYVKKTDTAERIELFVKDQVYDKETIENKILIPFFESNANIYKNWSSPRWDKIYLTSLVKETYRKYTDNFQMGEDMIFALRYLKECNKVVSMDNSYFYEYRILPSTMSRGFNQKMYDNYSIFINQMERLCTDCGYKGKAMTVFRDNCYLNMLYELKHTKTMDLSEKAKWKKQLEAKIHDRKQLMKLLLKEDFPMKQFLLKLWHRIK